MIETWWIAMLGVMLGTAAVSRGSRASPPRRRKDAAIGVILVVVLAAAAVFAVFVTSRGRGSGSRPLTRNETQQRTGFSKIEIRSVSYSNGQVRVEGSTDLPDGALVNVDFDIAGSPDSEADDAVSVNTEVYGGAFAASIEPPRTPAFARGPYVVDVLFSPRAQRADVLRSVGANGEYLRGEHVRETFGFKVIEVSKQVDLKLRP